MTSEETRDRILRLLWDEIRSINAQNVRNLPAAGRVIDSGADSEDVVRAMTATSYEAVFRTLQVLTREEDPLDPAVADACVMLHEDLLSADPTGLEGSDVFE